MTAPRLPRNRLRCSIVLATLMGTAACTSLGGNVSGDFACRAPGGSCAPMTAIDAAAVETVLGPDLSIAGDAAPQPERLIDAGRPNARPTRTGERTLRIVFPAYVDAAGVLHDEATAHAVVEASAWTFAPGAAASATGDRSVSIAPEHEISRSPAPSSLREAIAGASAPAIEGLESLPAQAPHPIRGVDAPALPRTAPGPSSEALAAARAGHRIAKPGTAAIRPAGPPAGPPYSEGWSLPRGKVVLPSRGDPADTAKRIRELAKPSLSTLGGQGPREPDLDDVFAPAIKTEGAPK